ncbi:hypothetical protein, partial [Winogradskyella poriferorum]|uniref:hypothetical protein n=1 Tax=Winogradskyella poriferorum TaxID=307627 RepID=UPI003D65DD76
MKKIVELVNRNKSIVRLKRENEDIIFENVALEDNFRTEYFLFCQEDDGFLQLCQRRNDLEAIDF